MMKRTRVSGQGRSIPGAATAGEPLRRAILALRWRNAKRWVSFWCCLSLTGNPGSLQVWKASLSAGWIERGAGGSPSRLMLECAGGPVCRDGGGRLSAGEQTGGSGFPRRDAGEGQVRRWLMNHRQGHWNRLKERAVW